MPLVLNLTSLELTQKKPFMDALRSISAESLPRLPTCSPALFDTARTHTSFYGYPKRPVEDEPEYSGTDYERLEFLGDGILSTAITIMIWDHYPHLRAGAMTLLKHSLVMNVPTLAYISNAYGLQKNLRAHGSQRDLSRPTHSVVADLFEAYVGAVYLESGEAFTQRWLSEVFLPLMKVSYGLLKEHEAQTAPKMSEAGGADEASGTSDPNYVSRLEEWKTKRKRTVEYQINEEMDRPRHAPMFRGTVWVGEELCGEAGESLTKKELKQRLAKIAYEKVSSAETLTG
ncbi:ribonuclease iii [Phaffia rhodozyma]|uniref:Ribonuclease iii n=1 Tax=Phaffia rhodozyma TaxID=264483 RepID=A0A0F7SI37_PHARH|nr:ribonuclease iii [Phaffia rhodozyma]CDZ97959.1 ribonuclease iii [Phaffia rhodozyma]